jgi:hypothetical protein
MQNDDRLAFESLGRTHDFGQTRTAEFPAESSGAALFAELAALLPELETHAAAQTAGKTSAQTSTMSRGTSRTALLDDVAVIRRTARVIALDNPDFVNNFRVPRGRLNDQQLLAVARNFAAEAVQYKAEFIHYELPADFIEDLNADIENFEQSVAAQHQSTDTHVVATQAFETGLERGLNIKRKLDVVVRNKYRNDAPTLAAWVSASHTKRTEKPKAKTPVAPTTPSK